MRRLRKESPAHRGLRPLVLAPAAALLVLAGLAACSGGKPAAPGPAGPRSSWFQLRSGIFDRVSGPGAVAPAAKRPWTIQSRVADTALLGETLYCAVNGSGMAAVKIDAQGGVSFSYRFDPLIFAHRTVTALVPRQGEIAVHLYYNALLNTARPQDLAIRGICLVAFLPGLDDFAFIIPPFQRRNPEWEAVGFAPASDDDFFFEWKYTDASETRFAYTRFRVGARVETKSSRGEFLAALGVPSVDGAGVPAGLASFFVACRGAMPALPQGTAVHFAVRSRGNPPRRSFFSAQGGDSVLDVPVFDEAGSLYGLLPGGRVRVAPAEGPARTIVLPALPAGFRYTDLAVKEGMLVLPWEESSFTDVGAAGLLVTPLGP